MKNLLIIILSIFALQTDAVSTPVVESIIQPIYYVTLEEVVFEDESECDTYLGPRYGFTDSDIYLLAQLLCGSANIDGDGEYDFVRTIIKGDDIRYDQISLVLCVVMNRVRSDDFPNTVKEVVMEGPPNHSQQFSVMPKNSKTIPHQIAIDKIRDWCKAYDVWDYGVQNIPEDHLYFKSGSNNTNFSHK